MAADDALLLLNVPHIRQRFRWDCGLACCLMTLKYLNRNCENFDDVFSSLGIAESVWTIDLARIMQCYGVRHHMCTVMLGVDDNYAGKRFYRQHFDVDQQRVNTLFQRADELQLCIEHKSVQCAEIVGHLQQCHVAIVLVDYNLLNCVHCRHLHTTVDCAIGGCFSNCVGKLMSYQGHFIVVCGYDAQRHRVYYRNPASGSELCVCSEESFDRARKADGTDHDVLFVWTDEC